MRRSWSVVDGEEEVGILAGWEPEVLYTSVDHDVPARLDSFSPGRSAKSGTEKAIWRWTGSGKNGKWRAVNRLQENRADIVAASRGRRRPSGGNLNLSPPNGHHSF